jgi:hypothetical protein
LSKKADSAIMNKPVLPAFFVLIFLGKKGGMGARGGTYAVSGEPLCAGGGAPGAPCCGLTGPVLGAAAIEKREEEK